jgi:hypothetical protein
MADIQQIAERYIASWNEADATRRRTQIGALWADNGHYVDPMMQADGHDGIAALITGVHTQFPDCRFTLNGSLDGHGPYFRFSWRLGSVNGSVIAQGTDFAELAPDERLARVTGFLDQVPGAA